MISSNDDYSSRSNQIGGLHQSACTQDRLDRYALAASFHVHRHRIGICTADEAFAEISAVVTGKPAIAEPPTLDPTSNGLPSWLRVALIAETMDRLVEVSTGDFEDETIVGLAAIDEPSPDGLTVATIQRDGVKAALIHGSHKLVMRLAELPYQCEISAKGAVSSIVMLPESREADRHEA